MGCSLYFCCRLPLDLLTEYIYINCKSMFVSCTSPWYTFSRGNGNLPMGCNKIKRVDSIHPSEVSLPEPHPNLCSFALKVLCKTMFRSGKVLCVRDIARLSSKTFLKQMMKLDHLYPFRSFRNRNR